MPRCVTSKISVEKELNSYKTANATAKLPAPQGNSQQFRA